MESIEQIHIPVLLDECVKLVVGEASDSHSLHSPKVVVDCTLGLAGHTQAFLQKDRGVRVIGIDRDVHALELARQRLDEAGLAERFTPVHSSFDQFDHVLDSLGIDQVDRVFMDLGLSSLQIDDADRGFSYSVDSPLDMRMDDSGEGPQLTASEILNTYPLQDLTRIFQEYGEEKFSRLIARAIVERREEVPFLMSLQLVDLVDEVVPKAGRPAGNPAKRVFQALRIEVNGELEQLAATLPKIALRLKVGGRIVVESYHSLEDKTVKKFFAQGLTADVPPGFPVIPAGQEPYFSDLTHGAVKADEEEVRKNPRSQSVRLRAVELIHPVPDRMANIWINASSAHEHVSVKHMRRR
jgi:16S rRNA (cytosine1402-N4)-methyltransferase